MKSKYVVGIYGRLSKEDGDKIESNSISSQRELCLDYLKSNPDMTLYKIYEDDGYSGVSFERPFFMQMMEDVKSRKINCIIVKDLSRFGRNWIETGKYIQQIFPYMGVRFIAITDGYDSENSDSDTDGLILPIRNLINDAYAADISQKIRAVLDVKRKNGEYVGAFASYGYKKSPDDKHKLIIDEKVYPIIRMMVNNILIGVSLSRIKDKLNEKGVPTPMDYRREAGENYTTSFKTKVRSLWHEKTIIRIVTNEVNLGHLVQGKRGTVNYKDKKVKDIPKNEHIRVENTHTPIMTQDEFDLIQKILFYDTRIAPNQETVYMFSGLLFCGDCKQNMIRKTVPRNGKKYFYYACSTNKKDKGLCSTHNISEKKLEEAIFCIVKQQIEQMLELDYAIEMLNAMPDNNAIHKRISDEINTKREFIKLVMEKKRSMYDDLYDGIISKEDFRIFNNAYDSDIEKAEAAISVYTNELKNFENDKNRFSWIEKFKQYRNIDKLDRSIVLALIDKIFVYEDKSIEVCFNYSDEYVKAMELISEQADVAIKAVI